jgi:hypothetical protein
MTPLIKDAIGGLFAVCCQIPFLDDVGSDRTEPADGAGLAGIWTRFTAGVALLGLSIWSAAWLVAVVLR